MLLIPFAFFVLYTSFHPLCATHPFARADSISKSSFSAPLNTSSLSSSTYSGSSYVTAGTTPTSVSTPTSSGTQTPPGVVEDDGSSVFLAETSPLSPETAPAGPNPPGTQSTTPSGTNTASSGLSVTTTSNTNFPTTTATDSVSSDPSTIVTQTSGAQSSESVNPTTFTSGDASPPTSGGNPPATRSASSTASVSTSDSTSDTFEGPLPSTSFTETESPSSSSSFSIYSSFVASSTALTSKAAMSPILVSPVPSRSVTDGSASSATHTTSKKWIIAIAVLASVLALVMFVIGIWWLRRRRLGSVGLEHASSSDDGHTFRGSVVSNHELAHSPTIMCAGDRASYPALAKALADASYPADPDVTDSAQIAPTGHGGPATGQDCMPARLSRLSSNSDGATWDVNGSATAAVLTGNRFAAISPVPPARLAPSPTTLHWPAQSAQVEYASPNQYASAAVPVVQARGVSNNPFRQPDRKSTGGVLEYAYDGIQDASAARSAVPRRASTNPFRTANRPWIAHTVSPPPVPAAQLNMTPPYVSHDLLEPVRPWQPTSIPVNPGYTTGLSADVQQSHVPWVSDSESPTQADMWWPVMSPTSKSREGAMQHTPVGSVEPGPGAVFCHAI